MGSEVPDRGTSNVWIRLEGRLDRPAMAVSLPWRRAAADARSRAWPASGRGGRSVLVVEIAPS